MGGWGIFEYIISTLLEDGIVPFAARSCEAYGSEERGGTGLRLHPYVWYLLGDSGWRIYMEDAHISQSPLTDKKNSLFAVFDGHGGTPSFTQEPRFPPLLSVTS
jgi:hypothetical protein